jgi:plastocyanin
LFSTTLALGALVAGVFVGTLSAGATSPPVHLIGVDNATPSGHNFEYVDFFPHSATKVHLGDVIDFAWNAGSPDGFHTATLLRPGQSVAAGYAAPENQLVVGDEDKDFHVQVNPKLLAPSNPTCGHVVSEPCVYSLDNSRQLNSGAMPTAPGGHFFVTTERDGDVEAPTTINFVCLIHPGMVGSFTIVPEGSAATTSTAETAAATAQYNTATTGALAAEAAVEEKSEFSLNDGTHTITMTAGTASSGVEVLEMLPRSVEIRPGDKVKWVTSTRIDIHTVTFPNGSGSASVDPLPFACEVEGDVDAASTGPPNFGCSSPTAIENHIVPQPQGPTAIASTSTVASSGIIAAEGPLGFPTNYTFSFPNSGTFAYQCKIHDNMVGTIVVKAAEAENPTTPPVLAQTGGGSPSRSIPLLIGALGLLVGLAAIRLRSLVRQ